MGTDSSVTAINAEAVFYHNSYIGIPIDVYTHIASKVTSIFGTINDTFPSYGILDGETGEVLTRGISMKDLFNPGGVAMSKL